MKKLSKASVLALLFWALSLSATGEPPQAVLTIKYEDFGFAVDTLAGYWSAPRGEHLLLGVDLDSGDARLLWLELETGKKLGEQILDGGWIDSLAFIDPANLLVLCNYSRTLIKFSLASGKAVELKMADPEFVFAAPFRLQNARADILTRGRTTSTDSGVYRLRLEGREVHLDKTRLFRELMEQAGFVMAVRGLALSGDGSWGVFSGRLDDEQERLWRFEIDSDKPPLPLFTGRRISSPALCGGGTTLVLDSASVVAVGPGGKEVARLQLPSELKPAGVVGFPDRDWALVSGLKESEQQLFLLRGENGWAPEGLELGLSRPVRYRADYQGRAWFQTQDSLNLFLLGQ